MIANVAVILSGVAVLATGFRALDLIVGAGIGFCVMRKACEILGDARIARRSALDPGVDTRPS